ncbi:MAG: hypothetical protein IJF07_04505, partial [Lachnospiraceae bacterium]|nr:hypothetical protein [Lachnospiraceae bacterium]
VSGREIFKIREIERICRTTVEEKKFPGAAKVIKAKADKYLNQAWELHEHEDMELMKKFLQRKMEEEGCDALELAAVMLKMQVGDKSEEIPVDEYMTNRSRGRLGTRANGGRAREQKEGREFGRDSRRRGRRETEPGREDRRRNRGEAESYGNNRTRRRRDSEPGRDGRRWDRVEAEPGRDGRKRGRWETESGRNDRKRNKVEGESGGENRRRSRR